MITEKQQKIVDAVNALKGELPSWDWPERQGDYHTINECVDSYKEGDNYLKHC